MNKFLIAAAAPLALAACSGGGADADGDGEVSAEEAASEAANIRLEPGQWRMTMAISEIDAPDMSEQERQMIRSIFDGERSVEQCLTEEDVAEPEAEMFGGDADQNCSYTEFDMSGGRMLIEGSCQGPEGAGSSTMRMEGSYSPDSYDMTMETVSTGTERGDVTMRSSVTGERIGECAETESADS